MRYNIFMKFAKGWPSIAPLKITIPLLLVSFLVVGFYLGTKYQKQVSPPLSHEQIIQLQSPISLEKDGVVSKGTERFTTRELQFKPVPGWWINMTTNPYSGDNWTELHPTYIKGSRPIFVLKAVNRDFEPTLLSKYLTSIAMEQFVVSGVSGKLIIGKATAPTGPDITCPECYLGRYKHNDTVAIALIQKRNIYYSFEGKINLHEKEFRQILSSFSFLSD